MKRALAAGFLPLLALAQGEALFDDTPSEEASAPAAAVSAPFSEWDGITQLSPRPVVTPVSHAKSAEPTLPSLSLVGEFPLPDSAPEGLSGIAWRGGIPGFGDSWDDLYALVEDSGGRLHSATIGIDRGTGAITNAVVSPAGSIPGAADLEGVCCGAVPVAGGTVPTLFASDERGPAIWAKAAFDASSPEWASLPLPEPLRRCRFNRALESLALSPDGRLLVLERTYGLRTRSPDDPRASLIAISIYLVDPPSSAARTAAAQRPPVLAKTLLWRGRTGRANYEGMTLGPELADGSRALILVSDGDVTRKGSFAFPWAKRLLSFRLRLPSVSAP